MKIIQVDSLCCRVEPKVDITKILKVFEYDSSRWKQGAYKREEVLSKAYACNHPHKGWFYAGLLPRVQEYCAENDIPLEIISECDPPLKFNPAVLPGIEFREDQLRLHSSINEKSRGQIKSPTGSGKTVLAGGIISQYPSHKAVFCVHTKALFNQTLEEFRNWFGDSAVGEIGDSRYAPSRITVLMIQTATHFFMRHPKTKEFMHPSYDKFCDLLVNQDILIYDEVQHLSNDDGPAAKIARMCPASIRLGFSATPKEKPKKKDTLVCEGLIGPIIGEFTLAEGIEKGILAKPRLKLVPVPKSPKIAKFKRYQDIYKEGIILNQARNRLIAREVNAQMQKGNSVLVMITDREHDHGGIIQQMLFDIYGKASSLVHGGIDDKLREKIKKDLNTKKVLCVIVTSAWREGVNIPSLDCVINAIGGESEITVIQAMGRGLRTTKEKTELLIIDFLDPYDFLARHTISRLKIYNDMGILNFRRD